MAQELYIKYDNLSGKIYVDLPNNLGRSFTLGTSASVVEDVDAWVDVRFMLREGFDLEVINEGRREGIDLNPNPVYNETGSFFEFRIANANISFGGKRLYIQTPLVYEQSFEKDQVSVQFIVQHDLYRYPKIKVLDGNGSGRMVGIIYQDKRKVNMTISGIDNFEGIVICT